MSELRPLTIKLRKFKPLLQLPENEESGERSNERTGKPFTWPTIQQQIDYWNAEEQSHKDCTACGGTGYVIEYDEKIECPME